MPLVIPAEYGIAAFVLTGAVGTQPYVTTMGVDLAGVGGDYATAADTCFLAYADAFLAETSSVLTLDRVTLFVNDGQNTGSVDSSVAPQAGVLTGAMPPTAMSAIARKVTNRLGRKGRGRMFLPGVLTETNVDQDGTIVSARRTQINTACAEFIDRLENPLPNGSVFPPGVIPYLLHTDTVTQPDRVRDMVCSDLVGWIRGRIR